MHEYKTIIDRYIDKWDKILFSTKPVDRDKATKAVIDAYSAIDLPPPEILNDYLLPISYGDRQEIYYVLCDNIQRPYSHVYCQFPNEEPTIYAECISSLMATIAQCYRDGGYYVAIRKKSNRI